MAVNRRALLRTGFAVTAVGALGAAYPIAAGAVTHQGVRAVERPEMHGTDAWGARSPSSTIEVLDRKPTYIVVHHTSTPNSDDLSLEHAFAISRSIQNYHMDNNGWIDSGQQLTHSRGAHITEGRHRSLEILDGGTQHVLGANVGNHNSEVIGIENEGTYNDVDVSQEVWDSLVQLVAYIAQQYGIAPTEIKGHRDFNDTDCPGDILYGRLPELRDAVGGVLGQASTETVSWPLLKPGANGAKVLAAQHLLRARGASEVPTDGVFGQSTFAAVARLAKANSVSYEPCYASRVADESGFIGVTTWPLLVRTVQANDTTEDAQAARVLLTARGERANTNRTIDTPTWMRLLA